MSVNSKVMVVPTGTRVSFGMLWAVTVTLGEISPLPVTRKYKPSSPAAWAACCRNGNHPLLRFFSQIQQHLAAAADTLPRRRKLTGDGLPRSDGFGAEAGFF